MSHQGCKDRNRLHLVHRRCAIDCTVRNLSVIGACLMVTSRMGIPNEFELVLDRDKVPLRCSVVWRAANRFGVVFTA